MAAGNKGDCIVFDLFKNRISHLEKEISKKEEIISFLTEQLSVNNPFTNLFEFSAKPKSRKKKCEQQSPQ